MYAGWSDIDAGLYDIRQKVDSAWTLKDREERSSLSMILLQDLIHLQASTPGNRLNFPALAPFQLLDSVASVNTGI